MGRFRAGGPRRRSRRRRASRPRHAAAIAGRRIPCATAPRAAPRARPRFATAGNAIVTAPARYRAARRLPVTLFTLRTHAAEFASLFGQHVMLVGISTLVRAPRLPRRHPGRQASARGRAHLGAVQLVADIPACRCRVLCCRCVHSAVSGPYRDPRSFSSPLPIFRRLRRACPPSNRVPRGGTQVHDSRGVLRDVGCRRAPVHLAASRGAVVGRHGHPRAAVVASGPGSTSSAGCRWASHRPLAGAIPSRPGSDDRRRADGVRTGVNSSPVQPAPRALRLCCWERCICGGATAAYRVKTRGVIRVGRKRHRADRVLGERGAAIEAPDSASTPAELGVTFTRIARASGTSTCTSIL